jgi:hypothetical protein
MTSELKSAQSKINGAKSRGPKTPEGKARSSQNACKHELRLERAKLLREDSLAYEQQLMRWSSSEGPENDFEEFLLRDQVDMACEIERTKRAYHERVNRRVQNADATELDAARELGDRLFFDPCGPTELYGSRMHDWRKMRTSTNGLAADPDNPTKLLSELKSTEVGCRYLLDHWEELRAHLESGGFWVAGDRLRAIRMIGHQPAEAIRFRRVAEIFAASFAIRRASEQAFGELLSDMPSTTLEDYVKDLRARWKSLVRPNQPDEAREILIDLVDENVEEIEAILEQLDQQTLEQKARGSYDRVSHDSSREAESMRRNWVRFKNGLARGQNALRKCRKDRTEREERRAEEAGDRTEGGGRRAEERRILARGERPWTEKVDASDALACQGFVPERCMDSLVDGVEEAALRAEDGGRRKWISRMAWVLMPRMSTPAARLSPRLRMARKAKM